jgi:hypothetical protein
MEENITVEPLLSIADNGNELRRGGWASRVEPPIEAFGSDRFQEGWNSSLSTGL